MKIFLILAISILTVSCSLKDKDSSEALTIKKLEEISVPVDSSTNYNFFMMDYFEAHGNSYLIGFDIIFQSVNIFDMTKKNLLKKIAINSEGENGMKKIDGVFFHNFDSIFLFHRYPTTLYMVDTSGTIKSLWDMENPLPNPLHDYAYLLEVSFANKQAYFDNKSTSIALQLYYDIQPPLKSLSLPIVGHYSLKENAVSKAYAVRPQEYLDLLIDKKFYGALRMNPRFVVLRDTTYVAYPFDHFIEVYNNKSGKKLSEINCRSAMIGEFSTSPVDYEGIEKSEKYYIEEPSYDGLIYDKYREAIYRIVKHTQPYKDANNKKNLITESPWSLLVLDKNLNILGESTFSEKIYDYTQVFVNRQGLVVKHLDEQDGVIKISVFDINRNEL
jgi:Domain of unknown function (DUF4221)